MNQHEEDKVRFEDGAPELSTTFQGDDPQITAIIQTSIYTGCSVVLMRTLSN